jgi:hypothetical protein
MHVHELNLFTRAGRAGEEVVAIDWAWLGFGAVGEELAPAAMRVAERLPTEEQPAFAQGLVAAYLAGLHEAGWRGDARLVRLALELWRGRRQRRHSRCGSIQQLHRLRTLDVTANGSHHADVVRLGPLDPPLIRQSAAENIPPTHHCRNL